MVAEACHPSTQGTEVEGSQAKVSLGEAMKSHLKTNEWTNTHEGFEFIQFFSPEPSVNYMLRAVCGLGISILALPASNLLTL